MVIIRKDCYDTKILAYFTALFAFSACGAKPDQKGKGHVAADKKVTVRQERTTVSIASATEQANTLPHIFDDYTKSDSALVVSCCESLHHNDSNSPTKSLLLRLHESL